MKTTLARMMLEVAKICTEVATGFADADSTLSVISDKIYLTQQDGYFDRGVVWIGTDFLVGQVTSHKDNSLTFSPASASSIVNKPYWVSRYIYSPDMIVQAINSALGEIRVTYPHTLIETGDGSTLNFALTYGKEDVSRVYLISSDGTRTPSTHWKANSGYLRFDYGYPPAEGDQIEIIYKDYHQILTVKNVTAGQSFTNTDYIHEDVNSEWVKWKAAERLAYAGMQVYPDAKELRIEEIVNLAVSRSTVLNPVKIEITKRTA